MPAVSVIVPTYQHRDFVLATLDSVFAQTFTDYELIVVNDGSPDDTAAVLRPLADAGRIRYVEQANAGQAAARNRGLALATGEFVAFLDDDDLWPADKLAWQVDALRTTDAVAIGGMQRTLRDGVLSPTTEDGRTTAVTVRDLYDGSPFFSPGQVLIRTSALRAIGGFDASIWGSDDLDVWMRLAARGPVRHVGRVALHYRVHAGNASRDWERMLVNIRRVLAKNLGVLPAAMRADAQRAGERFAYRCVASPTVQDGWSVRHGRLRAAVRALGYFVWPSFNDPRLALKIVQDCVPRLIRRTLRPTSRGAGVDASPATAIAR